MYENKTFGIPDLSKLYERVRDWVKEHQGEKGFIITDNNERCDTIWIIIYDDYTQNVNEFQVKAVRVNKDNDLQILYDLHNVIYDEDSVKDSKDKSWNYVQYDDYVYFIPTIFNIAESIEGYVNE